MSWLSSNWVVILHVAVVVVGAASVAALAVAPLTKTTLDDKIGGWLVKIKKVLDLVALNTKK